MSSYDDPRWYEQPEYTKNHDKPSANDFRSLEHNVLPESRRSRYFPEPNGGWRRTFGQFVVIAVLMVVAFLGGWYSHQVSTTSFDASNQSQSYENLFQQAWNDVDQYYVDRKAVNYKEMSYAAIRAMLAVLHDTGHTYFLTPEELQTENQQLSGTFVGVGLEIVQD
jgi:carboxyl-terminal processing protease